MAQQRNLFSFFKKGPETPSKGSFLNTPLQDIDGKKQTSYIEPTVESMGAAVGGTRYAEEKNRAHSGSPSSRQGKFFVYDNFSL